MWQLGVAGTHWVIYILDSNILAWYPARREHLVHTDALLVNKNGVAHVYDVYTA